MGETDRPDSAGGLFILAGDDNAAELGGEATDSAVAIGTVTIALDLSADGTFGPMANSAGGGFVIASGIKPAIAGIYATADMEGENIDVIRTITAAGSIGDILLNDISVLPASSLPNNVTNVVNAPGEVTAAAIIIAEALGTVTHQKFGDEVTETVLELSGAPFTTVFHRTGGPGVDYEIGDLLIAVL